MTIAASRTVTTAAVAVFVFIGFYYYHTRTQGEFLSIESFSACREAGYPVTGSGPSQCRTPDGRLFTEESIPQSSEERMEDLIQVTNITEGQIVTSPLGIEGIARGTWYFEASFPVELIDGNGKQLAIVPAQAKSDWMTTNFVPFSATLSFEKPATATGILILRKDNPSGLSENDKELRIPVRFSTTERTVKLYYYNSKLDTDAHGTIACSSKGLVSVSRTIPVTQTPLQDAIKLLLKGELTPAERMSGVTTEFPLAGVSLANASLSSKGLATLTFNDLEQKTSGGACRVGVLRAAIEATALQFETVKAVVVAPQTLFQP